MSDPAQYRVNGRWVTTVKASRCIHHVLVGDSCAPCGLADASKIAGLEMALAAAQRDLATARAPAEPPPFEPAATPPASPKRGRK